MWCDTDNADYCRERLNFPGCRILLCVERVVVTRGRETLRDVRYFVSSLDPASTSPEQLLHDVRGHWAIENSLHFVKDRWWDEDRHWLRRPGLAERMTMLNSCALSALRLLARQNGTSLRRQADRFAWSPTQLIQQCGLA